jgi:hypothetical protein
MKTSELTGVALDWAVAQVKGTQVKYRKGYLVCVDPYGFFAADGRCFEPSTDWSQGGPIIDREWIELSNGSNLSAAWGASKYDEQGEPSLGQGPTPLIAAMRCYVASELGDTIVLPKELENV